MTTRNLVETLRTHADQRPEGGALAFLVDGETVGARLTFAELDERARALGATLQQLTQPGERALLIYQPGLEFAVAFLGCQYAGVTAIPAPPPNEHRPAVTVARMFGIVDNARPTIILTTTKLLGMLRNETHDQPAFSSLRWQATDHLDAARAALWTPPSLSDDDLSFLQYTSGSTSTPKGVMVSHRNLASNLEMIAAGVGHTGNVVSWLPVFHDMGLIGNLLFGIHLGTETQLMSPVSFIKRPIRWLRAIAAQGIAISGAPNFAYDAVLRRLEPGDKDGLDLSGWRTAFCGAETVRAGTMKRFCETFAECGLDARAMMPCYGLAEATLMVSTRSAGQRYQVRTCDKQRLEQGVVEPPAAEGEAVSVVSCGTGELGQAIVIVDRETHERRADGEVGEIWVSGDNVARGYFGDPARTAETFGATTSTGEGPFLRTGDLGFMVGDELHVTGRIKEIIIVRGRCLYPQDIELAVEDMVGEFPEIAANQSAAFSLAGDERESIGLIVKVARRSNPRFDEARLIGAIQARALAEFEVGFDDIALVASSIPKTSSGKKMRTLCAVQMRDGLGEYRVIHRWRRHTDASPAETKLVVASSRPDLAKLVVEWIAREERVDPSVISTSTSFTELGLDSVAAVSLVDYLERELKTTISSSILEQHKTIDELVQHLN